MWGRMAHESNAGFPVGRVNGRWADSIAGENVAGGSFLSLSYAFLSLPPVVPGQKGGSRPRFIHEKSPTWVHDARAQVVTGSRKLHARWLPDSARHGQRLFRTQREMEGRSDIRTHKSVPRVDRCAMD